jgi:hypothetical protein
LNLVSRAASLPSLHNPRERHLWRRKLWQRKL